MRQPLYVPQTRNALDVLADMRAQRMHLAIVVDEFSGTDGLDYDVALFTGASTLYASSPEFGRTPASDADGVLNVFGRRASARTPGVMGPALPMSTATSASASRARVSGLTGMVSVIGGTGVPAGTDEAEEVWFMPSSVENSTETPWNEPGY